MTTGIYKLGNHDYGLRHPGLERDAAKAERPQPRPLTKRRVVAGAQTYTAYSAHHLLEATDLGNLARPGHPPG